MTTENNSPEERDIARLLKAAGRREELPQQLKDAWEVHFREEMAPIIQNRRWRQRKQVFALCASFTLVALIGLLSLKPTGEAKPDIQVSRVIGGALLTSPDGTTAEARSGQALAPHSVLTTPPDTLLSLDFQHYDLRLNSGSKLRVDDDGVHLLAGEIYISNESERTTQESITVHTAYATIWDIGTQFTVALYDDRVVSIVRKGSIVIETAETQHTAQAQGSPQRVSVNRHHELSSGDVEAEPWRWIYSLASGFELEGSNAYDFLRWSVRETGRSLVFASSSAEIYARTTTLHGALASLDPEQAVAPVLATTHLRASYSDTNTLRVELLPR